MYRMRLSLECHSILICDVSESGIQGTGWRRLIGSPKLQIILRKTATKYRPLLQKITCKGKGSYESSPPCMSLNAILNATLTRRLYQYVECHSHSSHISICWMPLYRDMQREWKWHSRHVNMLNATLTIYWMRLPLECQSVLMCDEGEWHSRYVNMSNATLPIYLIRLPLEGHPIGICDEGVWHSRYVNVLNATLTCRIYHYVEWGYSPDVIHFVCHISSSWHESICEWYRVVLFTLSATSRVRDMNHIEFVTWINMWIIPSDIIHFVCHISSSWYESYRVRDMNQYVNDTEWYYSLCLPHLEFVIWIISSS